MDNMAIWSRFTKSGKVEDYLYYKKSLNKNPLQTDEEFFDEDEYGRSDIKRTEYW